MINGATAKLIFNLLIAYCEQRDEIEISCDGCAIKSRCLKPGELLGFDTDEDD